MLTIKAGNFPSLGFLGLMQTACTASLGPCVTPWDLGNKGNPQDQDKSLDTISAVINHDASDLSAFMKQ